MKYFWQHMTISMPIWARGMGVIGFWILAEIAIAVMRKINKGVKIQIAIYIVWVNFISILMTLYFMYCPM